MSLKCLANVLSLSLSLTAAAHASAPTDLAAFDQATDTTVAQPGILLTASTCEWVSVLDIYGFDYNGNMVTIWQCN
ncbi:hypothetical protein [Psychromarinibacter sp. S121]|uniref:hypothetical protein n=1 Tax=Psychromarinibacter sp. S121 TaxID=3415127 RepID=UPI003C7B01B9